MMRESTRNGTNKVNQLIDKIAGFRHDPLGCALFSFPWGEDGELKDYNGPRVWQREIMQTIGEQLKAGGTNGAVVRVAIASGHGIGKSALISMLVHWGLSTCVETKIICTANTDTQLRTKLWPEVSKWFKLGINASWFNVSATSVATKGSERNWRADAIPWSVSNTNAFAGMHNIGKRIIIVFDEAAGIDDEIWEVVEGALTDDKTEIVWLAFGNPTKNTGRFRECFSIRKHRWVTKQIDSRTVEGTNQALFKQWSEDNDEDSDFMRVRVRGVFPRAGSMQLIPSDVVSQAAKRHPESQHYDCLIMSIDVARFGTDQSVICFRRGRDAKTLKPRKYRSVDTMTLAGEAAALIDKHHPDAVFIDETGIGGAVVDRLRQLGHKVIGVNNGGASDWPVDGIGVANKGAEMWARGREWLQTGGAIEDDPELCAELESREYGYDSNNYIKLEKKDDMKKRGLHSPDNADALMLTFAHPVRQKAPPQIGWSVIGRAISDWNPYSDDR
jgi:hypothetical protein